MHFHKSSVENIAAFFRSSVRTGVTSGSLSTARRRDD